LKYWGRRGQALDIGEATKSFPAIGWVGVDHDLAQIATPFECPGTVPELVERLRDGDKLLAHCIPYLGDWRNKTFVANVRTCYHTVGPFE
jgi:hypothetical protein